MPGSTAGVIANFGGAYGYPLQYPETFDPATLAPIGTAGQFLRPTGALAETTPRQFATLANQTAVVSGTLYLAAIGLMAGTPIASITWVSGTSAMVTATNQWFGLFDAAGNKLVLTADDGATAWATSSPKTLAVSALYTTLTSGLYYLGYMVAAATTPSMMGLTSTAAITGLAPATSGNSTTGLTTPASCPAAVTVPTGSAALRYGYVS